MKISESFEGPNSSLKKTFDKAVEGKKCQCHCHLGNPEYISCLCTCKKEPITPEYICKNPSPVCSCPSCMKEPKPQEKRIWVFVAYMDGNPFFSRLFRNHTQMKEYSAAHSAEYRGEAYSSTYFDLTDIGLIIEERLLAAEEGYEKGYTAGLESKYGEKMHARIIGATAILERKKVAEEIGKKIKKCTEFRFDNRDSDEFFYLKYSIFEIINSYTQQKNESR